LRKGLEDADSDPAREPFKAITEIRMGAEADGVSYAGLSVHPSIRSQTHPGQKTIGHA